MVRILCFSDLHRDAAAASRLVAMTNCVDLVIGAGDFANRHEGLCDTLSVLSSIEVPTVLVPGNGETFEELRDASEHWQSATVLHGAGLSIKDVPFPVWGVGGGIPITPFGSWSYDFDESDASELLAPCHENGVLVTHSPPLDTVDHDSSGRIRGSQAIRECIVRRQPSLAVCGHIHSDWTKSVRLGNTLVLNAGPAGVLVDLVDDHAEIANIGD